MMIDSRITQKKANKSMNTDVKTLRFLISIMAIDILTYNGVFTPPMTAGFFTIANNAW